MAKILVVDDEPSIRHFLHDVIERMGHESLEAQNGKEALEFFQEHEIDLSFVDINMPKLDGIGFLEGAKEVDPNAVVIMMTGYPSAETIIQTIEDDGYTYIAKPLHLERVQDLIHRGLEFRALRLRGKA